MGKHVSAELRKILNKWRDSGPENVARRLLHSLRIAEKRALYSILHEDARIAAADSTAAQASVGQFWVVVWAILGSSFGSVDLIGHSSVVIHCLEGKT